MPKYLIERNVPNAGKMGAEELRGVAQKSNADRIMEVQTVFDPSTGD